MFGKNPLEYPSGRKLTKEEIAEAARMAIIAELDAINFYLQLARAIEDEKIRSLFEDIAREEKTHVGEFLTVLKTLDKEQVEELKKGEVEAGRLLQIETSSSMDNNTHDPESKFEDIVKAEVRKTVDSVRMLIRRLPVVKLGRGVESIPLERPGEKPVRMIIPLNEIELKFRISQRSIDHALRFNQPLEVPGAIEATLKLVLQEEKTIIDSIIREAVVKLKMSSWDQPGASVIDIAKGVAELSKQGLRRPYILIVNYSRYVKLLAVSEKTGVTDLERVKMLVDDIVAIQSIPENTAILVSATPEILEVVYGGDAEVDYIGPEDGYHAFRLWSSIATRIRNPHGIVVMESE
ncbi:MAG: family 1 encapsulin nanocompartment shell protein [Desulfurococcaceae archaeon]